MKVVLQFQLNFKVVFCQNIFPYLYWNFDFNGQLLIDVISIDIIKNKVVDLEIIFKISNFNKYFFFQKSDKQSQHMITFQSILLKCYGCCGWDVTEITSVLSHFCGWWLFSLTVPRHWVFSLLSARFYRYFGNKLPSGNIMGNGVRVVGSTTVSWMPISLTDGIPQLCRVPSFVPLLSSTYINSNFLQFLLSSNISQFLKTTDVKIFLPSLSNWLEVFFVIYFERLIIFKNNL